MQITAKMDTRWFTVDEIELLLTAKATQLIIATPHASFCERELKTKCWRLSYVDD